MGKMDDVVRLKDEPEEDKLKGWAYTYRLFTLAYPNLGGIRNQLVVMSRGLYGKASAETNRWERRSQSHVSAYHDAPIFHRVTPLSIRNF